MKSNKDFTIRSPVFSIILPTYNRAHLLHRAIQSVINQTYENFELIIVDDGSTDFTHEVVKIFNDQRIIYVRHEQNKGVTAAYNTGLRLARGKYITFLGDDDELLPNALETAINKFNEILSKVGRIDVLLFNCVDAETGEISGRGPGEGFISYRDYLCGNIRGDYWGVINLENIDRNELKFEEGVYANEVIFGLRLSRNHRFYYIPITLYRAYRKHGGERLSESKTALKHLPKVIRGIEILLKEFGKEMVALCPKIYGEYLKSLGLYLLLNNETSRGRKILKYSLLYNFSLKTLLYIILSYIFHGKNLSLIIIKYRKLRGYTQT
jgi:glycosyltransferase involved in cell wall biosynthesis